MTRRKFTPKFKTKVVLEALKERHSLAELAQKYEIHPTQISAWKRDFLDGAEQVFESGRKDAQWCRETLEEAIGEHGTPEILNTDQGSQFTAEEFANYVLGQGIRLSMDGKGRATDNAFIERLWRNVKYEKIYLNPPRDGMDLYLLLAEYFDYYNHERRHQSIDYERPIDLFKRVA